MLLVRSYELEMRKKTIVNILFVRLFVKHNHLTFNEIKSNGRFVLIL